MMMISSPSPLSPTSSRVVLSDVAVNQQPATPPNQKPPTRAAMADLLPSPIPEAVDVIPTQQQTPATLQRPQPTGELLYKRRNAPYQFQVIAREYLLYPPLPNTLFPYPTDNANDAFVDANVTTPSRQPQSPPSYEAWEQCDFSYASAQDFVPAPAAAAAAAVGCFQTTPNDTSSFMLHETDASFVTPSKAPLRDFSFSAAAMGYEMDPSDVSPSLRPSPTGRRVVDNNPNESVSPVVTTGPTIALVAFGVRAEWIALDPEAPVPPLGTYVVVPGDRGKDVGLVVEHGAADGGYCDIKWRSHLPLWRMPYAAPRKPNSLPACTVIRRATAVEESRARYHRQNHQTVIAHTQSIVDEHAARTTDASFASCRVVGVETQHDNGKITVYFSADVSLRIAAVAVRLFHEFKCRVWMQQVSLDGSRISTTPTRRPRNAAAA